MLSGTGSRRLRAAASAARAILSVGLLSSLPAILRPAAADAMPNDDAACRIAIHVAEPAFRLPRQLLMAIAVVESDHRDPLTGVVGPWPWAIDVDGVQHFYASEADAIAGVQSTEAAGLQSIDVGCMQINLASHPHAFGSLAEAFDPVANVRYAARFLTDLHRETGGWSEAVAAYHSQTAPLGTAYRQRVAALWPLAISYGVSTEVEDAAHVAALQAERQVDPDHVLTPEFRRQLIKEIAFRRSRDAAMELVPDASSPMSSIDRRLRVPALDDDQQPADQGD